MRLLRIVLAALLLACCFSGCEEQLLQQYLLKYGIDVRGQQYTVEELRTMLSDARDEALNENLIPQEVEAATVPEFYCDVLQETTPRGLACLHCMQPEARTQANVLTTLLHRSCMKNVALNYLVDGTFSFDDRLLASHIDLLTENGRQLFLYFYMTNGPAQRRGDSGSYKTFGNDVSPKRFRTLIQYDPAVQAEYMTLVDRLIPSILYAQSRGAVVSIIPMLEDNLDDEAFEAMADLTLEALPIDAYVGLGRNPCPSCHDGNTYGVPDGVFIEVHTASPYTTLRDGVISNDGYTYADSDAVTANSLTLGEFTLLRDRATELNSVFILWNAKRQGLDTEFSGGVLPNPSGRLYPIPSITERRELLDFLKGY